VGFPSHAADAGYPTHIKHSNLQDFF
jgi:hypothetical protein